jgi:hypothetical protein
MNKMRQAYNFLHLREVENKEEDEDEDKEKEEVIQPSLHGQPNMQQNVPLSNEKFEPVQDGNIPQNSEGITSGQYDALKGNGTEQVSFQNGNFNQVLGYPKIVSDKITSLTQTFVPLIEVALIELLGNNQMYQRETGECVLSFQNNQILISFNFIYVVNNFIGTDIDQAAIAHDANYVLNRIKPSGANITKCEISTEAGTINIMGTM